MSQTSIILSCVLISIFLTNLCWASLLLVDRKNPCRAYGNASVYDITNLVKTWPVTLKGTGFDGREYIYWWSCAGKTRQCEDTDTAICQQRIDEPVLRFNAGNVSPQLWFGLFNGAVVQNNLTWDIIYPNLQSDPSLIDGTGIRVTVVHFIVDPNIEKPLLTMNGENKYTEYSITVRGKCIGQPAINRTSFIQGYCDPQTGQIVPALIPITNGLICVSCDGSTNSGCNDPYNPSTSGDLPVPYNTYCAKVVYSTYVERIAGGRSCTSGHSGDKQFIIPFPSYKS
ncbi:unnamed protein product [Rotaria sordida]|uniref:Uncharacterized protein n=1 Tax=Rotaria sordida TaxID=392033 RepID=A0A818Y5G8_9BILA|nr:unnamed protein product [Rotaria sordida]